MSISAVLIAGWLNASGSPDLSSRRPDGFHADGIATDETASEPFGRAAHDIHVVRLSSEISSEPFFSGGDLVITWLSECPASSASIVISTDPELCDPIGILRGPDDGCMAIPEELLDGSGLYYYRIFTRPFGCETPAVSSLQWFAVDPRFTGNRIVSLGYHPLGKSECSVTVRDARGNVHMAMEHWISDSGDREVLWLSSDDDGATWVSHGPVNPPEHTFAGLPSIAVDDAGESLCIAYLAGTDSFHMPRPVAVCRCDLMLPAPAFDNPLVFCGGSGCAWRRPFVAFDENGVVHAVWDGPFATGPSGVKVKQLWYSNSFFGHWSAPVNLASHPDDPVGGCHLVCIAGEVHALWEGGVWRYTCDYGNTWEPPLSEPAANVMPEGGAGRDIRWRIGSSTRIPGREEMVVAMMGERREGCDDRWTFMHNLDEIWLSRYRPGRGWSLPECLYSLDNEVVTSKHSADGEPVHFIERPDVSADGSGRIYLVWDETTGFGEDRSSWHRSAFLMMSRDDGSFADPVPIAGVDGLNDMKPLLGEARMAPGCDITWTSGQIPPLEARPVRLDSPLTVQGIMFATDLSLEDPEFRRSGFRGVFECSGADPLIDASKVERFPALKPTDAARARMIRSGVLDDFPYDRDEIRIDGRLSRPGNPPPNLPLSQRGRL